VHIFGIKNGLLRPAPSHFSSCTPQLDEMTNCLLAFLSLHSTTLIAAEEVKKYKAAEKKNSL